MEKQSFLFLAEGFEEIEALTVVDVLRRANVAVTTVSITDDKIVKGSHGIPVVADTTFAATDFDGADWLIIPGGLHGSTNLAEYKPLCRLLKSHSDAGGCVAAICAAPAVVLAPLGILDGHEATGYPGTTAGTSSRIKWRDAAVITSGNVVTGNGPASALRFALAIVAKAREEAIAQQVGGGMLFYPRSNNFYL